MTMKLKEQIVDLCNQVMVDKNIVEDLNNKLQQQREVWEEPVKKWNDLMEQREKKVLVIKAKKQRIAQIRQTLLIEKRRATPEEGE